MTLSTSENKLGKALFRYVFVTIFCACFGIIYEQFSHGVSSNWMIYFFLWPLIGGVVPITILLNYNGLPYPNGWCWLFFHSAIATLTIGSCMKGVLEIYGTSSNLLIWYDWVGVILFSAAFLSYALQSRER